MKRLNLAVFATLIAFTMVSLPAQAWIRSPATTFATLPAGATPSEGITTGPDGNVYVTTFGFPPNVPGGATDPGRLITFDRHGNLIRQVVIAGASPHLLGLAFHPTTKELLVLDFGAGKVLRVNPTSGASSVFSNIGTSSGLNALTFDAAGNVYVSDSSQGIIWRIPPGGGSASPWVMSPLLTTSGLPPFGANGVAFNNAGNALFVANTGNDSIVRIPVSGGAAGTAEVFTNSINGADGVIIDADDNLWVAANQSDELVVVDKTGKVIAKLGDFDGIDPHGAVRGLLFPASLVFSGEFVLVTNLALDTRLFGFPTVDSQWAAQVTRFTISKIKRGLPPIGKDGEDD